MSKRKNKEEPVKLNVKFDFALLDWRDLGLRQQLQVREAWAKRVNVRIKYLRDKGITEHESYALRRASQYLERQGRSNFSRSIKVSEDQVKRDLLELESFLSHESSSAKGIALSEKRTADYFRSKKGIHIPDNISDRDFTMFIHSDTFRKHSKDIGSPRAWEELQAEMEEGKTIEAIQADLEEYAQKFITTEEYETIKKKM